MIRYTNTQVSRFLYIPLIFITPGSSQIVQLLFFNHLNRQKHYRLPIMSQVKIYKKPILPVLFGYLVGVQLDVFLNEKCWLCGATRASVIRTPLLILYSSTCSVFEVDVRDTSPSVWNAVENKSAGLPLPRHAVSHYVFIVAECLVVWINRHVFAGVWKFN